jgi:hypothetical protein
MVFNGAMNAETFLAYLEQYLCPTLKRWDTVIIDNLSAHHVIGVEEPIRAVGAKLRYLPEIVDVRCQKQNHFPARNRAPGELNVRIAARRRT